MKDLGDKDATELASMVRRKEVSPGELLDLALESASAAQEKVNCFSNIFEDAARKQIDAGLPDGPFSGVPFAVKDLGARVKGLPITSGSRAFRDTVSDMDATLVERQKKAGLVIFGQTTSPEFGLTTTTESTLFGQTRNPWNLDHTPGASSGGSAAAVAAGIVPFAHANDGGGSIRIPASCSGLVGMKPSRGRTPAGPVAAELVSGFGYQHVVARTVRDCAGMLDATAGPEVGDLYAAPPAAGPYVDEVGKDPGVLRVAFWTKYWQDDSPTDPECAEAVEAAAKLLEGLGHRVEEKRPDVDFDELAKAFGVQWGALAAAGVTAWAGDAPASRCCASVA